MAIPTRRERILPRLIEDEMKDSFLDYSMSVIVQRALPDVRDGLKPVHRRILYAMYELGCSRTRIQEERHGGRRRAGQVPPPRRLRGLRRARADGPGLLFAIRWWMGRATSAPSMGTTRRPTATPRPSSGPGRGAHRQHPHGDRRLPAELRQSAGGAHGAARALPEPAGERVVGIAVGMSTNVPPHNLREVAAGVKQLVVDPDCTVDDLMRHVHGPDFPTAGFVSGRAGIEDRYRTGRGRIVMRARVVKEAQRGGKEQLVVTELPYTVSKSKIIEQIADLAKKGKADDISDIRDETDRDGIRLVIELKRAAKPSIVLKMLYADEPAVHVRRDHARPGPRPAQGVQPQGAAGALPGPPPGGDPAAGAATSWRRRRRSGTSWRGCSSRSTTSTRSSRSSGARATGRRRRRSCTTVSASARRRPRDPEHAATPAHGAGAVELKARLAELEASRSCGRSWLRGAAAPGDARGARRDREEAR